MEGILDSVVQLERNGRKRFTIRIWGNRQIPLGDLKSNRGRMWQGGSAPLLRRLRQDFHPRGIIVGRRGKKCAAIEAIETSLLASLILRGLDALWEEARRY